MWGTTLDIKPSAFLSASLAWWWVMLLTLAIRVLRPLLSLLLWTFNHRPTTGYPSKKDTHCSGFKSEAVGRELKQAWKYHFLYVTLSYYLEWGVFLYESLPHRILKMLLELVYILSLKKLNYHTLCYSSAPETFFWLNEFCKTSSEYVEIKYISYAAVLWFS